MKKFVTTLWANTVQGTSARISICYFSSTRTRSPKNVLGLYIRLGNSVVSIVNVPSPQEKELLTMLRPIAMALLFCQKYLIPKHYARFVSTHRGSASRLLSAHMKKYSEVSTEDMLESLSSVAQEFQKYMLPFHYRLVWCPDAIDIHNQMITSVTYYYHYMNELLNTLISKDPQSPVSVRLYLDLIPLLKTLSKKSAVRRSLKPTLQQPSTSHGAITTSKKSTRRIPSGKE